ncbi:MULTISPECIES: IclR family transcriptional regulator C-terminal domain-containing protein [Streptomyces]|uniref:IclR family transcriptional regulator C-terminal domain-containing protein n=1 Tax=Streptomyces glycanivorans TaxID=3033808 RepID=A0ABY9JK76_9ACTN|nr:MULTISPECIES: IclR family transcriptional regulator C-terminal domain-containing protein [unclassified Streptomyces]TXS20316.1 IclR family transcriptional regulator [Streptomyces sp. wa22]WLQ68120.1 IclR family transcriptional regulator C-terminal domain-containing protein [Streptomyces sp. Alt3]WSQ88803.1 helix-turn-helix domain-containing protein [Streptomyces sp. NBC_01212]WSR05192.1 helix-turn-helix domain-containing protein [Streptomyces sp. NBC_01208]WSR52198.1 helix-turn-helix domain
MPPTRTAQPGTQVPAEAVAPLMRGIAVLRRLTDADGSLSLSELERATGLARSTVDRVTLTLARTGYVRVDGRSVTLAPRLMELGNAYLSSIRFPGLLGDSVDALADELDESVSLAVPDHGDIRFVHQATRRRPMSLSFRIGDLLPAERTAPGALFATNWGAAEWQTWKERRLLDPEGSGFPPLPPAPHDGHFGERVDTARAEGCALDDQLIEPGLIALAVPVRDPAGAVACALNVVSHTSRYTARDLRRDLLPRLREAASAMERRLREASPEGDVATASGALASWTAASKQELGREFVESLARGLTVITAFGGDGAALTLSAVARATGLSRASARRALITLEHLGYVTVDDREHRLTPRVLSLGYPPLSRTTLSRIAEPHLAGLAGRIQESASLAVLADDSVQYVARAATRRIMNVNITVGTRFPAYATSLGRVLLADLPHAALGSLLDHAELRQLAPHTLTRRSELEDVLEGVRAGGYALVDEELEAGLRSIAVPVRDRDGGAVASINVAMHSSSRTIEECLEQVLPQLRLTAGSIESELHTAARFSHIAVV